MFPNPKLKRSLIWGGGGLGPDRNSGSVSGRICSGPVTVYLAGTRLRDRYRDFLNYFYAGLKSGNVKILLFMNYNLRYLNLRH